MDWAPIVILVLLVLLTVMTVIGHGIWVLLATIFGGGRSKAASRPCGFCGRPTPVDHAKCDWCGRDQHSALVAELADLLVVERQLRRFREKGAMKPEVADNLLKRLRAYRQQLLEPARQVTAPILAEVVREPVKPQPPAVVMPQAPAPATPQAPVAVPVERQTPVAATAGINPVARLPVVPQASAPPAQIKPAAPVVPRKSWNELLAGFMEESNIRWGELIGGLLLVCSSVALVVSLWKQLQQIPYIQSFIFLAVSAAVFGVGLYAHHRWKLAATSRGLLLIGMLLVPLNFVAMAVLSGGVGAKAATGVARSAGAPMIWTMALVSLAIFAWLTSLAARILVPKGWRLTVAAVVGDSATMVAMALWIHASASAAAFFAAAAVPVALFWGAVGRQLFTLARGAGAAGRRKLDLAQITTLLTLLGVTAFATFVALGLLVAQAADLEHLARLLTRFSLLAVLAALPALAAGLTVMRGAAADRSLGPYHLAGTSIALLASVLMLAALVLAWPQPGWLIAVGALDATALAVAAFRWRLPLLHAGAIACEALVYLIVFHLATGAVVLTADRGELSAALLRAALSAQSGVALAGLLAALAATAEVLVRAARRRHAFVYLAGAAVTAVAGLVLTTFHGVFGRPAAEGAAILYPDALRAAILYGVYGAGSLALVARWRRRELSFLGVALLAAAPAWALWCHSATHHVGPLWAAVLAGEALAMAVAAAVLQYVFGEEKGDCPHLCEAPGGPFRQMGTVPFFRLRRVVAGPLPRALGLWGGSAGGGGLRARGRDLLAPAGGHPRPPHVRARGRGGLPGRGLFPHGVAIPVAGADVDRLVPRAGRFGPHLELQLHHAGAAALAGGPAGARHGGRGGGAAVGPLGEEKGDRVPSGCLFRRGTAARAGPAAGPFGAAVLRAGGAGTVVSRARRPGCLGDLLVLVGSDLAGAGLAGGRRPAVGRPPGRPHRRHAGDRHRLDATRGVDCRLPPGDPRRSPPLAGLRRQPGRVVAALGRGADCRADADARTANTVVGEKGDSPHLCEAPFGPFRQMGTVPFFPAPRKSGQSPAKAPHSPWTAGSATPSWPRNGCCWSAMCCPAR